MGKARRLSIELPNRELGPCIGILAKGSNEDLGKRDLLKTSIKILQSLMVFCISISIKLSHFIYYLPRLCVYFPSLACEL
jgi:hypothetical protein